MKRLECLLWQLFMLMISDIYFMDSKDFPLLLELKWKFITKYKYYNLGETKEFFGMYISHNCKNWKIFVVTYYLTSICFPSSSSTDYTIFQSTQRPNLVFLINFMEFQITIQSICSSKVLLDLYFHI